MGEIGAAKNSPRGAIDGSLADEMVRNAALLHTLHFFGDAWPESRVRFGFWHAMLGKPHPSYLMA
jgi:hypothetical protein